MGTRIHFWPLSHRKLDSAFKHAFEKHNQSLPSFRTIQEMAIRKSGPVLSTPALQLQHQIRLLIRRELRRTEFTASARSIMAELNDGDSANGCINSCNVIDRGCVWSLQLP